ncbi:hypothetical protein N7492_007457 [Penicillium capsulatum]|uniref:Major facilitator superfamily (MFS) profile domain-containing protein n=1 Tax=Penicillium capsulatum TaxID=69766 RepID=A0A9W9LLB1_9EURO|nr:hypothetical protein N7492_007457 [Penicillium capsulatum]KAJ6117290.1 hypothetical protein N7512_007015 [Penicillium capsulatum]
MVAVARSEDSVDPDESQPLLAADANARGQSSKKLLILIACGIFLLAVDFGFFLSAAPQTAVFEKIICRDRVRSRQMLDATQKDHANDPCKSDDVQGELALILGYKDGLDVLPSILLSLPYGVLSDHWGRKPVLFLGILGILLGETWVRLVCFWSNVLPLRMVWLSGLFRLVGGGDQVVVSMAVVMVADIFSEEERSTALFRLQSCALVAEVLASPTSAYLMTLDPWFPFILGTVIFGLGSIPALFLPETLEDAKAKRSQFADESTENPAQTESMNAKSALQELVRRMREFRQSTQFIWRDSNVYMMIFVLFVTIISKQSTNILLQYASKKFEWSIARASLLVSVRGIVSIATFLLLMPASSWVVARYLDIHGKSWDHRMSQGAGILSILGFAVMGLAPNAGLLVSGLVILSLGSAFLIAARSLVTALVLPDHVGTLYSAIAISTSIGQFIAGPLFAYLFRLGMHLGHAWMGLPFLQAALFYAVATAGVWRIRIRRSIPEEDPLLSR